VQFTLAIYVSSTCTFDLYIKKRTHDVFFMVVNFISKNWEPMHVTIGLFETSNIIDIIMVVP
jgi:hypothetical protein